MLMFAISIGWLPILMIAITAFSCKKDVYSHIDSGFVISDTIVNTLDNDTSFERGGSNYPFYSMGTYLQYPTDSDWSAPGNLRPVIATYNWAPDTVRKQLAIMYANGQRRIALDLWHTDLSLASGLENNDVFGHVVNSKLGKLLPQHEANLKNLLHDIDHQGFLELVMRFDVQGYSSPREWTAWDESKYQTNWSFISSTIRLIQAELPGLHLHVIYDLEGELGGDFMGLSSNYEEKLWRDYTNTFGSHNTYGFSFAVSPGRVTKAIAIFDKVGKRPDIYGFDVYGNEFWNYSYLKDELAAAGEDKKPIVANEVYYNDTETYSQLLQVRSVLHLNIKFLLQWPLRRGTPVYVFPGDFPADFSAYDH